MRLRNKADIRTLLWVLVPPAIIATAYFRPEWVWFLSPLAAYWALALGVIAHNHNHCPVFAGKNWNTAFGCWISIFYGYPTFAWIPTHNLNHHKLVNKAGDATITWRYTNKHNALVAATYFFVSSYYQSHLINDFIAKTKKNNKSLYRRIVLNYGVWIGGHVVGFAAAVAMHGWWLGFKMWLLMMGIPAFFALWAIMLFNYEQHVHADVFSEHNHSRNFVSPVLNFLLFNNGYHAAHHENAGLHWSKLKEAHDAIADEIHPALKQKSCWWYWFKQYVLTPFAPSLGSQQIGRAPFEIEELDVRTDDVPVGEAGTNAQMV